MKFVESFCFLGMSRNKRISSAVMPRPPSIPEIQNADSLVFNCQKSKVMVFSKKRQRYVNDPSFVLNGNLVSCTCTQSTVHLGVVLNNVGCDDIAVDDRIRRFFGAVNTSVARLGGKCFSELAWTTIMDAALFPVLTYGSHLWDLSRSTIAQSVNQAYRKGIRRGLCMRNRESVRDRLGEWFVEAVEKVKKLKTLYIKRALHSVNTLVRTISWQVYRKNPSNDINLFAWSYI